MAGEETFRRYVPRADRVLVSDVDRTIVTSFDYPRFKTSDIEYMAVSFHAAGHGQMQVYFNNYEDDIPAANLGIETVQFRTACDFEGTLPIQGPWAKFRVDPIGGNVTYSLLVWTVPKPLATLGLTGDATGALSLSPEAVFVQTGTVTAGTDDDEISTKIVPGMAHFSARSLAVDWTVSLDAFTPNGTVWRVATIDETCPGIYTVFLPPKNLRLRRSNNGVVDAIIDATVWRSGIGMQGQGMA